MSGPTVKKKKKQLDTGTPYAASVLFLSHLTLFFF